MKKKVLAAMMAVMMTAGLRQQCGARGGGTGS